MTHLSVSSLESSRLNWLNFESGGDTEQGQDSGKDVIAGLLQQPKSIPCRYFYDDRGSELFETITDLPEYYPTRTEQTILETAAGAIAQITGACDLVELGSGSSRKTRLLLNAYDDIDPAPLYCPIDVSVGILQQTAQKLLREYQTLSLLGIAGTYEQALTQLPQLSHKPRLLIFLGSTLGNLAEDSPEVEANKPSEQQHFFQQVQAALNPGDYFLLGVDLQKSISVLEAAYNDSQGVTAAFNLNLVTQLNHRFGSDFDRGGFRHVAFYNEAQHQIEMHLESLSAQTVKFERLQLSIDVSAQERIRTEISRKFNLTTLLPLLQSFGLETLHVFQDPQQWFALLLCRFC